MQTKEVLTPMSGEKIILPIADGTAKLSGGDQVLRTSSLIRDSPERGEEQGNLRGESDGSSSTPLQDSSLCDGEAKNDFWTIQEIPFTVITRFTLLSEKLHFLGRRWNSKHLWVRTASEQSTLTRELP